MTTHEEDPIRRTPERVSPHTPPPELRVKPLYAPSRIVVVESPFRGNNAEERARNTRYAVAAMRDCIARGEAPIASHVLYAMSGVLDEDVPEDRTTGIAAGLAIAAKADAIVFYDDLGMSKGMTYAYTHYINRGMLGKVEFRQIPEDTWNPQPLPTPEEQKAEFILMALMTCVLYLDSPNFDPKIVRTLVVGIARLVDDLGDIFEMIRKAKNPAGAIRKGVEIVETMKRETKALAASLLHERGGLIALEDREYAVGTDADATIPVNPRLVEGEPEHWDGVVVREDLHGVVIETEYATRADDEDASDAPYTSATDFVMASEAGEAEDGEPEAGAPEGEVSDDHTAVDPGEPGEPDEDDEADEEDDEYDDEDDEDFDDEDDEDFDDDEDEDDEA